jgi:hypothetical protein
MGAVVLQDGAGEQVAQAQYLRHTGQISARGGLVKLAPVTY